MTSAKVGLGAKFADLGIRCLTAVAIAAAQIALLWAGPVFVEVELVIVGAIAFHELISVPWAVKKEPGHVPYPSLSFIATYVPYLMYPCVVVLVVPRFAAQVVPLYPVGAIMILIPVVIRGLDGNDLKTGMLRIGLTIAGCLIPFAIGAAAVLLEYGTKWFVESVVLIAINDTSAYFCGRLFGKHQMTVISPKKTMEGFAGGVVFTLLAGALMPDRLHTLVLAAFDSLVAPFAGVLGSAFKRSFGVKDYGWIVIGHGGVLDRIDCQLFACIFAAAYVRAFVHV